MTHRHLLPQDDAHGPHSMADWDDAWDELWDTADPAPPPGPRRLGRVGWSVWAVSWSGFIIILAGGSYAASAWIAADGMLHALGRRDTAYMLAHLDNAKLLAGMETDLRHMAAQSTAGRSGSRPHEGAYLERLARGTSGALHRPDMLGLVLQARIMDPISGSEALDLLDNGPRRIIPDSLTSFHIAFAPDRGSMSGMTLCFAMENLTHLDWKLVQIGWPELGSSCKGLGQA